MLRFIDRRGIEEVSKRYRRNILRNIEMVALSYTEKTLQLMMIILDELYSLCNNTE
jgi:hypothetical protein